MINKKTYYLFVLSLIGLIFYCISCKSKVGGNNTSSIHTPALVAGDTSLKSPPYPVIIASLDSNALLARLFSPGSINHANEIGWTPAANEAGSFPVSSDGKCYTKVDTVFYYRKSVDTLMQLFALVVFGTYKKGDAGIFENCHACSPMMGLAVLRKTNSNQWEVSRFMKQFLYSGSWGNRTNVGLVQYGKNKYALDLSSGDFGQGFFEYGIQYYNFEDGNFIYTREAETISNVEAVEHDSASFSYELKPYFIPSDKPYWNLRIISKGKIPEKGSDKGVPATITEEFTFNPKKKIYERVSLVKI